MKPLTLLTGHNAAGKSSCLQPLLLLAQASRRPPRSGKLELNGPLVRLGTAAEVLNRRATAKTIEVSVGSDNESVTWLLEASETSTGTLEIRSVSLLDPFGSWQVSSSAMPVELLKTTTGLAIQSAIYLSAARATIRDAYPIPDITNVHADVGVLGEFASWWYSQLADDEVDVKRRHSREEGTTLRRQLDAFLCDLFPGAQANAEAIARTALARLTFRLSDQSDWLRPANVGFGLSYAFPLIVSALIARPGQVLMVDSPEAHLHPLGQSQIGRFIAIIAASGVQMIVETHSDHVLNGIRLAVREGLIHPNLVSINYFGNEGDLNSGVNRLRVDRLGAIDTWPKGFFDQGDLDMITLAGLT